MVLLPFLVLLYFGCEYDENSNKKRGGNGKVFLGVFGVFLGEVRFGWIEMLFFLGMGVDRSTCYFVMIYNRRK